MKMKMKMGGKEGGEAASASYIYSYNIPEDVYGEILYRLPSRDLVRFKLVCKDWGRLISSKGFIHKHLQRSKADCNHLRILVESDYMNRAEILDCANNTSKKISCVHWHILGCWDGLVLYYDSCLSNLAALNPYTRESLKLISLPKQFGLNLRRYTLHFSWFGHHPFTAHYVLLLAYGDGESGDIKFEVYSLSLDRNNINTINSLPLISSSTLHDHLDTELSALNYGNQFGTLLHGRLHCPVLLFNRTQSSYEFFIIVYDFETSKITRMMTHSALKDVILMLGVVDGCLCAIQAEQVWMMKEYGVEQSWTKYAKLDRYPFAVSPNGDVFTNYNDGFMINRYRLRDREAKIVSKFDLKMALSNSNRNAIACIDSLISPTLLWREEE